MINGSHTSTLTSTCTDKWPEVLLEERVQPGGKPEEVWGVQQNGGRPAERGASPGAEKRAHEDRLASERSEGTQMHQEAEETGTEEAGLYYE